MTEALLLIAAGLLIGRVLAEFHNCPVHFGLSRYRVSIEEYRAINKSIYKDH